MVDAFALGITHLLLALAAWRLLLRNELDDEDGADAAACSQDLPRD
ncbi:MAG TPA: hypothetical protein VI199_04835 [Novosphingobium sp.]